MEKFPQICRKHNCIIYYESDTECPLCLAVAIIEEKTNEYETLKDEWDTMIAGASQRF